MAIDQIVNFLCSDKVQYVNQATSFKSAKQCEEEDKRTTKSYLQSKALRKQIAHAFELIENYGSDYLAADELEALNADLKKLSGQPTLTEVEERQKWEKPGCTVSIQLVYGLSQDTLSSLYKIGYKLCEDKLFTGAIDMFTFLFFLNTNVAQSAHALGRCYQAQNKPQDANDYYNLALLRDPNLVASLVSSSECFLKLGNVAEAKSRLDKIDLIYQEHPDLVSPWGEKISALRKKCSK